MSVLSVLQVYILSRLSRGGGRVGSRGAGGESRLKGREVNFPTFFWTNFNFWLQAISVEVLPLNGDSLLVDNRQVLIIHWYYTWHWHHNEFYCYADTFSTIIDVVGWEGLFLVFNIVVFGNTLATVMMMISIAITLLSIILIHSNCPGLRARSLLLRQNQRDEDSSGREVDAMILKTLRLL